MDPVRTPPAPKQERSLATRHRLLDAAVDELLASGYTQLTASAVSHRAGVSRGAQQHHFPHKDALVTEAVRRLAERQIAELRRRIDLAPRGRARVRHAFDTLYEQYSGPLFAAMLELSLACHHQPQLERIVREQERMLSKEINDTAREIFPAEVLADASFSSRWSTALAITRGVALLRVLGHPASDVDRQWESARRELLKMLLG
jgi:AcrR family transcriptional regulator